MRLYVVTTDLGDRGVSWKEPDIHLVGVYDSEEQANLVAALHGDTLVTPVELNDTPTELIDLSV